MLHVDVVQVQRAAQHLGSQAIGCNPQHPVELMGLHGRPIMAYRVDPCPSGQEVHQERLCSHRVIGVVNVLPFVVFRKNDVVNSEFGDHRVIHNWISNNLPIACLTNGDITPMFSGNSGLIFSQDQKSTKTMKKKSATQTKTAPQHESREDRARTNAGKTANSKVRSEGRTLAAVERNAVVKRTFEAEEIKSGHQI